MANPTIFIANTVVTVLLTWMALNYMQMIEQDPIELVVTGFQRIVYYSQLDGSVMAPVETLMSVVRTLFKTGIYTFLLTLFDIFTSSRISFVVVVIL